ncbi:hypothetical protein PSEUBRA_001395 [Kalmanozyma brasiliensis GHG001]|uniref:uncharacterized protein n=1 Tax=Kalmanozyma brasiliensis (strain GHG001) TaxID=1365824 RepID=UPI0028680AFD|nr:uncharacterized protein PSEUBRA_001395 [Kalmanozyma brasiliensis GHG001]KAF6766930.1 hypothetical protein PSEUBRA_001395 [Kalmanozyma brasiliensis GHG001]
MTGFTSPFARLPSRRRRDIKARSMQPLDINIAQLYNQPGPSSAPLFGLSTPSMSLPAKSPLRRAFGLFTHANASLDAQPRDDTPVYAPRPVRPPRPVSSPESCLAPRVDAYAFPACHSEPIAPLIIVKSADKRRSFLRQASSDSGSPRPSLRSIRQSSARRSVYSLFASPSESGKKMPPKIPLRSPLRPRLGRRASEESFHCRGADFDGPPAADSRPSLDEQPSCPMYAAPMPRSISLYAPIAIRPSPPRCMSHIFLPSHHEGLGQLEDEEVLEKELAGLGLHGIEPASVVPMRMSFASQVSLTDSTPYSLHSNGSTDSLTSLETHYHDSLPELGGKEDYVSSIPSTPTSVRAGYF